jgi:sugar O-acyltransferase (sialic acid O-acetyltransferase NeuD family)
MLALPRLFSADARKSTMNTLYLCGAGNSEGVRLALTINRRQLRWDNIYLLDDDPAKHNRSLLGVRIIGSIDHLADVACKPHGCEVANLVARTTRGRAMVQQRLTTFGLPTVQLLSPDIDTFGVTLGEDIVAYQHAIFGPESSIGDGAVVFMGGIVGHECTVGKCCVIAANAVLNARVHIGNEVYVGTNSTVLPEVTIGDGATIAAGSVVMEDVPAGATVIGVPGRVMSPAAHVATVSAHATRSHVGSGKLTELEHQIAEIWKEALQVDDIGLHQRFFDLGGDSLMALRVCEKIKHETGIELSIVDMFQFPTVQSLSQTLLVRLESATLGTPTDMVRQSRVAIRRAIYERYGVR